MINKARPLKCHFLLVEYWYMVSKPRKDIIAENPCWFIIACGNHVHYAVNGIENHVLNSFA